MPVESIGLEPTQNPEASQNSDLGQEDLFKILLAELSYQDPLEPMDNKEFLAQLAQFTNLEETRQFNQKLDSLLTVQASNQSITLLGRVVEVKTDSAPENGTVIGVAFNDGSPILTIQKTSDNSVITDIRLSQINSVN